MSKTNLNSQTRFIQLINLVFRAKNNELIPMLKNVSYRLLVLLSIFCLLNTNALAQSGDAGQPGEFLRYGVGGRALGMGHTFTGLADDASAIYWNPAGMMNMQRAEFSSMYTDLFLDSRFTYMAVAMPRSYVGAQNAVGLAWVNLNMADFDQRDGNNASQGSFDFYEQAFMLSFAREWVNSWGVLNYGLNLKTVSQNFPGYDADGKSSGTGFGADIGVTFRPINVPLLKEFIPLRWLVPLQLGFAVQNVLQPKISIGGGEEDVYPRMYRWGFSYGLWFRKWAPVKNWHFNIVADQEYFQGRKLGTFAGAEALVPILSDKNLFSVRAGFNSRTKSASFGGGLKLDYIDNAAMRIDFAYALKPHEALDNDFRLFLTIDFGEPFDADYFAEQVEAQASEAKKKINNLQVLTRFQYGDSATVNSAALLLAGVYDEKNQEQYLEFVGGIEQFRYLVNILFKMMAESDDPNVADRLRSFAARLDQIYQEHLRNK